MTSDRNSNEYLMITTNPIPKNIPVINLNLLLLSLKCINWVNPSNIKGIVNKIAQIIETNRKKLEIINPIKKPKKIPRHLEQKTFSNPKKGILRSFFL
jgi:hypothetical protein